MNEIYTSFLLISASSVFSLIKKTWHVFKKQVTNTLWIRTQLRLTLVTVTDSVRTSSCIYSRLIKMSPDINWETKSIFFVISIVYHFSPFVNGTTKYEKKWVRPDESCSSGRLSDVKIQSRYLHTKTPRCWMIDRRRHKLPETPRDLQAGVWPGDEFTQSKLNKL